MLCMKGESLNMFVSRRILAKVTVYAYVVFNNVGCIGLSL